jgi:hypothetical protein
MKIIDQDSGSINKNLNLLEMLLYNSKPIVQ